MARKSATAEEDLDALDLEDEDFEAEEDEETKAKSKGKKSSKKDDKPKGIGAREMAEHLGAEPKTFRAWLRRKQDAGDIELDREAKSRYDFGSSLNSVISKKIIKAWNEDSHESGEGLKKAQAAKKKKKASSTKKKATKKKSS